MHCPLLATVLKRMYRLSQGQRKLSQGVCILKKVSVKQGAKVFGNLLW